MLPELQRARERNKFLRENLDTLTLEQERAAEPAIFAEIDKELEEYNWCAALSCGCLCVVRACVC